MASYKLKHFRKITDRLAPGEELIAGTPAMAPGGMRRQMIGGAIAMGIDSTKSRKAGDVELPARFVLGLTNQRLLITKPDMWMGRPKELLYAIPLSDLVSVEPGRKGAVSKQAVFTMRDGAQMTVESQRAIAGKWFDELVERIQPLLLR